jgi:ParB-like chromosome segregation protein Spo0J
MKFETVLLSALSLDPSNVRKHSRKNLDAIKASLRKFGQQKPIVVDAKGIVLAGNGTLTAAQELGWTKIEITRTELTGVEATAFAIADNRTAELAEWDEDGLAKVLESLKVEDADLLAATGYDSAEVDKMLGAEVTQDEVPEPPADPITKLGDLWILGDHRVLCGDSTKEQDVTRLMDDVKVDAVLTDPPYGTGMNAPNGLGNSRVAMVMAGDEDASLARSAFRFWSNVAPIQIWWGANYFSDAIPGSSSWAVWDKDHHGMTFADAELAYVSVGGPVRVFRHAWSGNHKASERDAKREHPTQKPVALYQWVFDCWLSKSKIIADPFLGSGTTLIAAEQLNRKCYGLEISPAYCDVIVQRWETLTGKKAVLEKLMP